MTTTSNGFDSTAVFSFFEAARTARGRALSCTREHFTYCLDVLPPVHAHGFYGVGEPYSHEGAGVTRHWFAQVDTRFFCTFGLRSEAAAAFAALSTSNVPATRA